MKLIMDYKDEEDVGKHIFEISPSDSMFEGKHITSIKFTLKDPRKHIWTNTIEDWVDPLQQQPADPNRRVKDNYHIFHHNKTIILYPFKPRVLNGKMVSDEEWVNSSKEGKSEV
jgi:hypothetical protein